MTGTLKRDHTDEQRQFWSKSLFLEERTLTGDHSGMPAYIDSECNMAVSTEHADTTNPDTSKT